MDEHRNLEAFEDIKQLTDPRRLKILRHLMGEEMTLTHLGEKMGIHPAKVRYHLKKLEQDGLVEQVRTEVMGGYVKKYYRASAGSYSMQLFLLPHSSPLGRIVATGSDDLALDRLARLLCEDTHTPEMITLPQGSLNGLVSLRQGLGQLAGVHLYDANSHEYNAPFVRYFFPDRKMRLMNLVNRQQGLVVFRGNPLGIEELGDLCREDVRFINRNPGSGTRLWLERALDNMGVSQSQISGFEVSVQTHMDSPGPSPGSGLTRGSRS